MKNQKILSPDNDYLSLDEYFLKQNVKQILLICGNFVSSLKIGAYFRNLNEKMGIKVTQFSDFLPNPTYETVIKAIQIFRDKPYEMIVAIGGGSAIDLAKCVKLFSGVRDKKYLQKNIPPVNIPLLAIPTTAGTGSESTKYAVIYYEGVKQSITDDNCIPDVILLDASLLDTLPIYQRKSTLMDAFCHALESYWSINSTSESKLYSKEALKLILKYGSGYLKNQKSDNSKILIASNLSGKAINITETTAGHALCYKLTSMYGLAHGHAAAICVLEVWRYMSENLNNCIDIRGQEYLKNILTEIAEIMNCKKITEAISLFECILKNLELEFKITPDDFKLKELVNSVNAKRLKNTPIYLDKKDIQKIYCNILN